MLLIYNFVLEIMMTRYKNRIMYQNHGSDIRIKFVFNWFEFACAFLVKLILNLSILKSILSSIYYILPVTKI